MSSFWMGVVGRESLIAADDTWGLLAVMAIGVFFAIWLEQKYECMIRKSYNRNVFVIEVSQADRILGYYAGKDRNYSIVVNSLNDAINLEKYSSW